MMDIILNELLGLLLVLAVLSLLCRILCGRIFVSKVWFCLLVPLFIFVVNGYRKDSVRRAEELEYMNEMVSKGRPLEAEIGYKKETVVDFELVERGSLNLNLYRLRLAGGELRIAKADEFCFDDFFEWEKRKQFAKENQ